MTNNSTLELDENDGMLPHSVEILFVQATTTACQ